MFTFHHYEIEIPWKEYNNSGNLRGKRKKHSNMLHLLKSSQNLPKFSKTVHLVSIRYHFNSQKKKGTKSSAITTTKISATMLFRHRLLMTGNFHKLDRHRKGYLHPLEIHRQLGSLILMTLKHFQALFLLNWKLFEDFYRIFTSLHHYYINLSEELLHLTNKPKLKIFDGKEKRYQ